MPSKFLNLLNIRTRLLLLCLAVSTPLLVIGAFVIWKEYQSLNTEETRATTYQAALAVRALSNWISAEAEEFRSAASVIQLQSADLPDTNLLDSLLVQHRDWKALAICDSTGKVITSTI